MRDVSIIIINYNSAVYTKQCVESIHKYTPAGINYEIIIVDNNSRIDDYRILKESLTTEEIRIIRSRINLGFAGG
ncbi:MAG TPA: glycosyltransferase, partial [Ignavibacteriales bacterium]|nr:glycosyltransferase [Ignavibacteriales bacterium]